MKIEVLFTITIAVWEYLKVATTPVVDAGGGITGYQAEIPIDIREAFKVWHSAGLSWGDKVVDGRKLVSAYIDSDTASEEDPRLAWVVIGEVVIQQIMTASGLTGAPVKVIGAWYRDQKKLGAQYGMAVIPAVLDDEGNEVEPERVEGEAVYPFDRDTYIQFCSDDVTYDANGNELLRTSATEPKQIHLHGDQPARRWA